MKKICLPFIFILLSFMFLLAEDTEHMNPFQNYIADPNVTTFEQAFDYYSAMLDDNARLMLSSLYLMELERTLEQIDVHADSIAPNIPFNYAKILLEIGRYDEAIEIYEMLNNSYPNWSCPWRHKGEAYYKSGNFSEAEMALIEAIETRVEHYDAYVMLAEVQEVMGKYEEALAILETGFSYKGRDIEDPDEEVSDIDTQFLYLRLLEVNNKTEEADELHKKLKIIAPDDQHWEDMKHNKADL